MKEGVGVMECWSNGIMGAANVMGIAALNPSYGTPSRLRGDQQLDDFFHVVDCFQIPHRYD
jgi:hypothetical protein